MIDFAEEQMNYEPNHKNYRMNYDILIQLKDQLTRYKANHSEKINKALEVTYTYESNRIEGNTLTLQETALIIEKGLTIGGKSLNEHLEAINHAQAIDYIKDLAKAKITISERDILQIHALILQGIDRQNAGVYRSVQVLISGAEHIPPPPYKVAEEMEKLMQWYNANRETLHPVELSAEMHERLVSIHPFTDGNGRTSRLLMNLILLQGGYPIAILKGDTESRLQYYNALEEAQVHNNKQPFKSLIYESVKNGLNRLLDIVK